MEKVAYQQGDIRFVPVEGDVPVEEIVKDKVLALGEATGHRHMITTPGATVYMNAGIMYVKAPKGGATVWHNQHNSFVLPEGLHKVGHVQEYDHFKEEAREVAD